MIPFFRVDELAKLLALGVTHDEHHFHFHVLIRIVLDQRASEVVSALEAFLRQPGEF